MRHDKNLLLPQNLRWCVLLCLGLLAFAWSSPAMANSHRELRSQLRVQEEEHYTTGTLWDDHGTTCTQSDDDDTTGTHADDHGTTETEHHGEDHPGDEHHGDGNLWGPHVPDWITSQTMAAASARAQAFEIRLMERLVDINARITTEALVIDAQSTDTFVLALSAEITSSSTHNMAVLLDNLQTWYGITYTPKSYSDDCDELFLGPDDDMSDLEFVERVVGFLHHEIALLRLAHRKAVHVELKDFAVETIVWNMAELEVIRDWLVANDLNGLGDHRD